MAKIGGGSLNSAGLNAGQPEAAAAADGIFTTKLDALLAWARKFSLFQYPFATACCGMEFFAVASPRYDLARFGAEAPRFSPRQSDVLWVVGTISQRQGPVLKRIYEQMTEPKWVIAFGTCASCGGFYDNYATIPGVDKIVPVDVYIPGCPPRPEAVLDGLMLLQEKITKGGKQPLTVPPRELPGLAQLRVQRLVAGESPSGADERALLGPSEKPRPDGDAGSPSGRSES